MQARKEIKPQEGYQYEFLTNPADIIIGGGSAGGGKTFGLLLSVMKFINVDNFGAVIFRRETPQITNEGGLLDQSKKLFEQLEIKPELNRTSLTWQWANNVKLKFAHLQREDDVMSYDGSEIPFIAFDELIHFTKKQFFYMLSRNRSTCGVRPRIYATTNPQASGWVKDLLAWWLYPDDYRIETLQGFPIKERIGKLRYFFGGEEKITWGDTKEEVIRKAPQFKESAFLLGLKKNNVNPYDLIKSITFLTGDIYGNKALLDTNPQYLANLNALDEREKMRLAWGCWKMLANEGEVFEYSALLDMFTNEQVQGAILQKQRYLTCDVALQGSDEFVFRYWDNWRCYKTETYPKCDGQQVIELIQNALKKDSIQQSSFCYDADGIGAFIQGFFPAAIPFHGNAIPMKIEEDKQEFENLRSQCIFYFAQKVNERKVYIAPDNTKQQTIKECTAIKRKPYDGRKHGIIPKDEIKQSLQGKSPDRFDSLMMRSIFDLQPQKKKTPAPIFGG